MDAGLAPKACTRGGRSRLPPRVALWPSPPPPKCVRTARMLGELLNNTLRPFFGAGFVAIFGTTFTTATTGTSRQTGGTLGGGSRCIIPSAGNFTSIHRRHASANFSQSPGTVRREPVNARSQSAMPSTMTRRRASPP